MGSVWTGCTHIWSERGHHGLQRPPKSEVVSKALEVTVLQAMNTWGVIMLCSIGLSQPRNSDRDFARSQLPQKLRYIIIYSFKHYKIKIIYYYIFLFIVLTFLIIIFIIF